jgi:uncharacterized protein
MSTPSNGDYPPQTPQSYGTGPTPAPGFEAGPTPAPGSEASGLGVPVPYGTLVSSAPNAGIVQQDERTMALLSYILGFFTGFLGPLLVYVFKKDQSRFVAYHALQATFLQIAIIILYAASGMLSFIGIGLLLFAAVGIGDIAFAILAGVASSKGEWYEVPVIGQFAAQQAGVSLPSLAAGRPV